MEGHHLHGGLRYPCLKDLLEAALKLTYYRIDDTKQDMVCTIFESCEEQQVASEDKDAIGGSDDTHPDRGTHQVGHASPGSQAETKNAGGVSAETLSIMYHVL